MKSHRLILAIISLGLASPAMAGPSEAVAPAEDHNPWTVEASLLYLFSHDNETSDFGYRNQDHEEGYRLKLGYQPTPDFFNFSLSYLYYRGTERGKFDENGPRLDIVDFELSKGFDWGFAEGTYSFGLRSMQLYEPYGGGGDVDYTGFGPLASIELVRPLSGAFSIYCGLESAFTFGDDDAEQANDGIFQGQFEIGVQYDTTIMGADSYIRLGYEHQFYHSATYGAGDAQISGLALTLGTGF